MASSSTSNFDISKARDHFPALRQDHQVYFDNAGGSQVLGTVAAAIKDYLEETNVQLGATYDVAKQSTDIYDNGLKAAANFINASVDEIVIGPSTTQLFSNLSLVLNLRPHSELILSSIDHEANTSPWVRLAALGNHTIKWWKPSKDNLLLTAENLRPLLSEKTALVTCTHTSNVLGGIHDIRAIADEVHTVKGARLCVDGVALAPHRAIDVKALGCDFYSFSWYKVYGPHIAILYASAHAQETMGSLGHYFHTGKDLSTKLNLAASSYELVAALPNIVSYFGPNPQKTWSAIEDHETWLSSVLLTYLCQKDGVTIYGEKSADKKLRVPVISFSIDGKSSKEVVEAIERRSNFGCRWGYFYSKRMVDDLLGLEAQDGVVRVSMVHYNTEEEIKRYVTVLDEVLAELKPSG